MRKRPETADAGPKAGVRNLGLTTAPPRRLGAAFAAGLEVSDKPVRRARAYGGVRAASSASFNDWTNVLPAYAVPRTSIAMSATSVGVRPTRTPLDSSASIFAAALPDEPLTIAPAWPIVLPGGAVTPAM